LDPGVLPTLVPSVVPLIVQLTGAEPRPAFSPVPEGAPLLVMPAPLLPIAPSLFMGVVLHAASEKAMTPPRIKPDIVVFIIAPCVV